MTAEFAAQFGKLIGPEHVIEEAAEREYYSTDISGRGDAIAALVLRPGSAAEVAVCVRAAADSGLAILARGGGMSYSKGYVPAQEHSVIIDMRRLDRIIEINPEKGFVTAEAGCNWARLYDALAEKNLRTPFFGPLSGIQATLGGSASQDAAFFGSASHGSMRESVLGIEIVSADGNLFWPDNPASFVGDAGAFGIKTSVTLKLIRRPRACAFASFAFDDFPALLRAQGAMANAPGLAECFGFDPESHRNLIKSGFNLFEGVAALGIGRALKSAVHITRMKDLRFSLHVVTEGETDTETGQALERIAANAFDAGGTALPDIIPRVTRARPFRPIKALLGPDGENWLPVHAITPHAATERLVRCTEEFFAGKKALIKRHNIRVSFLTVLIGGQILYEPQFFWFDRLSVFHLRNVSDKQRGRYGGAAANPEARQAVAELRAELITLFAELSAAHMQSGKLYPYLQGLSAAEQADIRALKQRLDPRGLMNPGALGL
ncbi:MAG: FAD-binding oxidoreductase [Alphaproteobacteria bacterium]|jgi:D-lactate dehydrogenase (cytochrome)|nr:FAD-binding oxidoreductase [Alphaproteobacteria bacterium]